MEKFYDFFIAKQINYINHLALQDIDRRSQRRLARINFYINDICVAKT